ncbi:MAG: class B sortase [Coriobacteriia bacterium]|nr:class B sortase [Coriobacteriia bacterium]MCL2750777.1 class B sortase [Coriobacteriia bacterium]
MSIAVNIGKKTVKMAHSLVEITLLFVILLLAALVGFTAWDSNKVYGAADPSQYEIYKPSADNDGLSFLELQTINPEVIAWLTVYGTHIDYPVTQSSDNFKYVNTNAKGRYSLSGAVFVDAGCSADFSDFNTLVHGHHMDKSVMFGEIGDFSDKDYFNARHYGSLYFDGQDHGIQFFAFLHVNAYDTEVYRIKILKEEEQEAYLELLLKSAQHTRNVPVTTDDRIILLSTCSQSSTDGRSILVGRITDETFDDPFYRESLIPRIDGLSSLWEQAPLWGKIIVVALLFTLLLWLIPVRALKKRSQKRAVTNAQQRR